MKAQDLRLGNLALLGGDSIVTISEICSDGIETPEHGFVSESQLEGIPLTEERLTKFGFRHEQIYDAIRCWRTDHFALTYHVSDNDLYLHGYGIDSEKIRFVHQLQNLFHSLTGEELKQA